MAATAVVRPLSLLCVVMLMASVWLAAAGSSAGADDTSSSAAATVHHLTRQQLPGVFFGGYPWLVVCHDGSEPIPSVVKETARLLRNNATVGAIDCSAPLESGGTLAQRARLDTTARPTLFAVANGKRHTQIFPRDFVGEVRDSGDHRAAVGTLDAKKLARVVRKLTSPELVKVASNDTLVSDCVENRHRACAVLHVDSDAVSSRDKKVVRKLMQHYRGVQFAVVDTDNFAVWHDLSAASHPVSVLASATTSGALKKARASLLQSLPTMLLFRPESLNPLSASLRHATHWDAGAHAIPAAFGHGFGAPLSARLRKQAHRFADAETAAEALDSEDEDVEADVMMVVDEAAVEGGAASVPLPRLTVSLCRHELSGALGLLDLDLTWPGYELSAKDMEIFKRHELPLERFLARPSLLHHPDAVFLLHGRAVAYESAAPYLLTQALWGSHADAGEGLQEDDVHSVLHKLAASSARNNRRTGGAQRTLRVPAGGLSSGHYDVHVAEYDGDLSFRAMAKWLEATLSRHQRRMQHLPRVPSLHRISTAAAAGKAKPATAATTKAGSKPKKRSSSSSSKGGAPRDRSNRASFADAEQGAGDDDVADGTQSQSPWRPNIGAADVESPPEAEQQQQQQRGGTPDKSSRKGRTTGKRAKAAEAGSDDAASQAQAGRSTSRRAGRSSSSRSSNSSGSSSKARKRRTKSFSGADPDEHLNARRRSRSKAKVVEEEDPDNTRTRTRTGPRPKVEPLFEHVSEESAAAALEAEAEAEGVDEVIELYDDEDDEEDGDW